MNKKGEGWGLLIISAVMIFIIGMVVINLIKPDVTTARLALDCATPASISDGVKLTCLAIDGVVPYFILVVLSITGGAVVSRLT
tara:strand:+ start:339 stop:590 length:252 start_codon:yes stop_codon:yes gene_type:complete